MTDNAKPEKSEGKLVVATSILTEVSYAAYASHVNMLYRIGKDFPGWTVYFYTPLRMPIHSARNTAAKMAIESNADYVLYFDDDCVVPPDSFAQLKARDKDIIAGLTPIRGYPYLPMFFRFKTKEAVGTLSEFTKGRKIPELRIPKNWKSYIRKDGLMKAHAIGTSLCLIKTEVFRNMDMPYFWTGMRNTEDIYFCMKALQTYKNVQIFVDSNVRVGHLLDRQAVTMDNVDAFQKFYKMRYPNDISATKNEGEKLDRGT